MKSFITAVVAATALSASYGAFAQSNPSGQLTRAEVRAELVQLEQAGYKPEVSDPYYPRALQTAQARVTNADEAGYGTQSRSSRRAATRSISASKPNPRAYRDTRAASATPRSELHPRGWILIRPLGCLLFGRTRQAPIACGAAPFTQPVDVCA
nr:DUF4148 domain-containing protein [Burkholderia seminalis]